MNVHGADDFSEAVAVMRRSRAWAVVENAARVLQLSARHSRVVATADRVRHAIQALPPDERRRALALMAAVVFAGHALLLELVPSPFRPALPRVFWLVLAAAATVAAVRRGGKGQASDA
jgi:alkylhydroperoxidase family enzyme